MVKNLARLANKRRSLYAVAGLIIIIAVILLIVLQHSNADNIIPSTSPVKTGQTKPNTQIKSSSPNSNSIDSNTSAKSDNAGSTPSNVGNPPKTPTGLFVSNHHPGGRAPTSETSVCNTTPGATCYIQFTQGATVKKLNTQTADSTGAVYWYWDVNSAGLSAGSWTITAVANLNGQIRTASDSLTLEVQS